VKGVQPFVPPCFHGVYFAPFCRMGSESFVCPSLGSVLYHNTGWQKGTQASKFRLKSPSIQLGKIRQVSVTLRVTQPGVGIKATEKKGALVLHNNGVIWAR